ncbi:MAG TPA: hypothetical protein VK907_12920 [Phnomibacter sp.]|nr:hypothetical protein [Phnomibacter sp.]
MKKIFTIIIFVSFVSAAGAQGFETAMNTARSAYAAGKLEEAHFALLQAMQEVDLIIGKEVLKLLPAKIEDRNANSAQDNVSSNVGFIGATINRTYGEMPKKAEVSIISNSPLIATLNSFLNMPVLGGMMSDANNKSVRVQGYKGRLSGTEMEGGKKNYELQIPLGSALFTFNAQDCTESQVMAMVNTLPLPQIAKLIQ